MRYTDRSTYGIYEEDRHATPRAGTHDRADAILPWRVEVDDDPPPPPVPPKPKRETRGRQAAAAAAADSPERVTPWLFRRVKTPVPVSRVPHVTHSQQKASVAVAPVADPKRSPPRPPAYHAHAVQPHKHPSEESFLDMGPPRSRDKRPLVVSAIQVQVHTLLKSKPAVPDKSDVSEARPGLTHRSRSKWSLRSARDETPRPRPPPPPETTHPPSYLYPEQFPAPPPYRASAEECSPPSVRSRSLPRSRKHSPAFDAPLPALPIHPALSSSAVSRIQAAHKVSKEFGDAVMRQEIRTAPSAPVHAHLDSGSTPHVGRRFMSASEMEISRKSRERMSKHSQEYEARQRMLSKPPCGAERCSGDSRRRAASANPGRRRNMARDDR
ncbi:hypothetical protein BC826DRAFT_1101431 [Russula brevipes]|nr:hypothetical protein BC826DRAFT_1101431 [Russula brevipes]